MKKCYVTIHVWLHDMDHNMDLNYRRKIPPMYKKGWRTVSGQKRNKIRKLFEISSVLLAWLLWASSNLSSSLHLLHCFLFCNHPISCTESLKYQIRLIPRKIFWSFNFQFDRMTSVTKVVYIWSTLL